MQSPSRALSSLSRKSRIFDWPIDLQIELFQGMVLPIMLYACEVWDYNVNKEV